jgi:hypothetical protein
MPTNDYLIPAGGDWIKKLKGRCSCTRGHATLMARGVGGKVSGTPAMRSSQAYPVRLGKAIVQAWSAAAPQDCSSGSGRRLEVAARRPRVAASGGSARSSAPSASSTLAQTAQPQSPEFEALDLLDSLTSCSSSSAPRLSSDSPESSSDSESSSGPWGRGDAPDI